MLNSNDWLNNNSNVKQPANSYYYPGGTIGGPVIIPGTRFNKNHDKLFFFTGFEYLQPDAGHRIAQGDGTDSR